MRIVDVRGHRKVEGLVRHPGGHRDAEHLGPRFSRADVAEHELAAVEPPAGFAARRLEDVRRRGRAFEGEVDVPEGRVPRHRDRRADGVAAGREIFLVVAVVETLAT